MVKRTEKGLTRAQAADLLGVSVSLVKLWEQDRRTVTEPHWQALVNLFGLPMEFAPGKTNS